MVCIPYPQNTAADYLLAADVVVLARENPEKPFSYLAVEVLKGDLDAPAIDLFLNSAARRRLAADPDGAVVLALGRELFSEGTGSWVPRLPGAGTAPAIWRSLGFASPRYEALVRDILAQAARWQARDGREARAAFFMPYLADAERPIRELAYLEVGRAPYDTIREADDHVPADQVRAFLADRQYFEWRPLYILLLGVDATPDDEKRIRAAMASHARFDHALHLSAWSAAFIEIDGDEAVSWLESVYLDDPDRDPDAVLEVVKALSVHGSRPGSGLRPRIAESYGALIEAHPSLAGWAARDLTVWRDWRFADAFADLRERPVTLDAEAAFAIDDYIGQARSNLPPITDTTTAD
jgi:hypothetical protein